MQSKYLAKTWRKIFQTFMKVKKRLSPLAYEFVTADITSNCTLRCTFCINDFSRVRGNTFMKETTFEKLRQKVNFEHFIDNLRCLVEVFSGASHPPRLRCTTMALKPNLDEIPKLVETCAQKYLSYTHEICHVYQVPHLSSQWKQHNLITNHDWQQLRVFAEETPYNCEVVLPPPVYYLDDDQPYSRKTTEISPNDPASTANSLPLGLNVQSDGTVSLYGKPDIQYKLDDLEKPGKFFKKQMNHFQAIINQNKT